MRRHMPRVEYFICSPSGRLYVAPPATSDPFAGKGYPLLTDKAALLGALTDSGGVPEDFLACNTSLNNGGAMECLVRAYSPTSLIQLHFNGRPVETVAVGQLGLSKVGLGDKNKPLVIGLSVKGRLHTRLSPTSRPLRLFQHTHIHTHTHIYIYSQDGRPSTLSGGGGALWKHFHCGSPLALHQ